MTCHLQESAMLVDPKLRQFSELPDWIMSHADQLKDRRIMMYCTGGVRCERASAFLKNLGPEFQDVYQLQGDTHKFLMSLQDKVTPEWNLRHTLQQPLCGIYIYPHEIL